MGWRQRVVIVGSGFAGIAAARALRKEPVDVVLVDRTNHHLFQPLLYQVAACALSPGEIAVPIRHIFAKQKNAEVIFTEVTGVNLRSRCLETKSGPIDYHFLVIAAGARNFYFGNDAWAQHATGLKTLEEALHIRRKVLLALEIAEQETDAARRRKLLTFCVIGGGPTGVELAGALSELSRQLVHRDFRHIVPSEISVELIEGGDAVLKTFSPKLQVSARRQLEKIGVTLRTGSRVVGLDEHTLTIIGQDGKSQEIPVATILWAAGVRASPLGEAMGVEVDRGGRVTVDTSLNIPGYEEVFCIGDMANCTDVNGVAVPGVAPAAMQQGKFAARQIERRLRGKPSEAFCYVDKGNLATIGQKAAVAEFSRARLSGMPAWLLWLGVHICFLVGFRNRYIVLVQWMWHYFTNRGGAHLITGGAEGTFQWPEQPRRMGRDVQNQKAPGEITENSGLLETTKKGHVA